MLKRAALTAALCALAMLVGGCKPSGATAVAPLPSPTEAQPKLPAIKLWMGPQEMSAEMALTMHQVETGMMFRTNMGPNDGMIFVFGEPRRVSFWMKNTILPLSAAYIDPAGTIVEIHDLQPQNTNEVLAADANVQYVLETPQGWFKSNHIDVGVVVSTEKGPLSKVFQGQGF